MSAPNAPGNGPANQPGQQEKKREIEIFAAPPPEPMSPQKKLAIAGAVVLALYFAYWGSTSFSASRLQDRIATVPVEAYGLTAKDIADMVVKEADARGVRVRPRDTKVIVGRDSALGRLVTIEVRYRRLFLPSKRIRVEVRCPNPLQPGTWDGVQLLEGTG